MEKPKFPDLKKNVVLKFAVSEQNMKPLLVSVAFCLLLFAVI